MVTYIKAEEGLNHTVIYTDSDGKYFRFSGGTRTWRNNNPGNLKPSEISHRNSQIGVAGKFAVFPNYEIGHAALIDSLTTSHKDRSINQLVSKFSPASDHNDVKKYIKFLRDHTGIKDDKKIKDFTPTEFEKLWKGIEKYEGNTEGTIVEISQIIHVHKDKKGLYGYELKKGGWISKSDSIQLARQGKLDVVVSRSGAGHEYIRARKGSSVNSSLSSLVIKDKKTLARAREMLEIGKI